MTRLILSLLYFSAFATVPLHAAYLPSPQAAQMIDAMAARLQISREVAWAKYKAAAPVNDPAREDALLTSLQAEGKKLGLSKDSVTILFKAQFAASRALQEELIFQWRHGSLKPNTPPLDLKKTIRPQLDQISTRMLVLWKKLLPQLPSRQLPLYAEWRLEQLGFPRRVAALAARPLN